jgi:hypothetical protein
LRRDGAAISGSTRLALLSVRILAAPLKPLLHLPLGTEWAESAGPFFVEQLFHLYFYSLTLARAPGLGPLYKKGTKVNLVTKAKGTFFSLSLQRPNQDQEKKERKGKGIKVKEHDIRIASLSSCNRRQ